MIENELDPPITAHAQSIAAALGRSGGDFAAELVKALLEISCDAVLVVDADGVTIAYNDRFMPVWGLPSDAEERAASGAPLLLQAQELTDDPAAFLRRTQDLYLDVNARDRSEVRLLDGRVLERRSSGLRAADGACLGRLWVFRDLSEQRRIEDRLHELSLRDELTGLANRRLFFMRAEHELSRIARQGGDLSLLMLDIDHFKLINDHWGHVIGDKVLKELGARWSAQIRAPDLIIRLGADEFAVLLPSTAIAGATILGERLRQTAVARRLTDLGEQPIRCTVSVGVAALDESDESIEAVMRRADVALYSAKSNGRNRAEVFDADDDGNATEIVGGDGPATAAIAPGVTDS